MKREEKSPRSDFKMVLKMVFVRGMFLLGEHARLWGGHGTGECEAKPLMEEIETCSPHEGNGTEEVESFRLSGEMVLRGGGGGVVP